MSNFDEIEIDDKVYDVLFEFYRGIPEDGTRDEYHILEVTDRAGNPVDMPEHVVIEELEEIRQYER